MSNAHFSESNWATTQGNTATVGHVRVLHHYMSKGQAMLAISCALMLSTGSTRFDFSSVLAIAMHMIAQHAFEGSEGSDCKHPPVSYLQELGVIGNGVGMGEGGSGIGLSGQKGKEKRDFYCIEIANAWADDSNFVWSNLQVATIHIQ